MNGLSFAQSPAVPALAALAAGVAVGFIHFRTLRRTADAFVGGRAARALALQLVRLALIGGFLFAAARAGALPLLAAAAGVLAGRALVMARRRKAG